MTPEDTVRNLTPGQTLYGLDGELGTITEVQLVNEEEGDDHTLDVFRYVFYDDGHTTHLTCLHAAGLNEVWNVVPFDPPPDVARLSRLYQDGEITYEELMQATAQALRDTL